MASIRDLATAPIRQLYQRRSSSVIRTRHVDLRERGTDFGVRIVIASDLHAREDWFDRACIADTVAAINRVEHVDLVALLGDFVGDDVSAIDWSAEEYAKIAAPTVGVLGNHDHWTDAQHVETTLQQAGVDMYTNRATPLKQVTKGNGGEAWLAGIDSCWTRKGSSGPGADVDAAFEAVPDDAEVIVLGHEPHLATMHEHALHLAGHTHCGQVRTPLLGDWTARMHMPRFSEPYPSRLYEIPVESDDDSDDPAPLSHRTSGDRRWVYTTAGVGYSTVDFRLFCPPEIVVLDV